MRQFGRELYGERGDETTVDRKGLFEQWRISATEQCPLAPVFQQARRFLQSLKTMCASVDIDFFIISFLFPARFCAEDSQIGATKKM